MPTESRKPLTPEEWDKVRKSLGLSHGHQSLPCPKWPIHFMDFIGGVNGPVRFQDSNGDWWDADSFDYGGFTNAVKWEAI